MATALGVEPYELPTPPLREKGPTLGSKDRGGNSKSKEAARPTPTSTSCIRLSSGSETLRLVTLDNPARSLYPLSLETGRNADGLNLLSDVESRFEQALRAYDAIYPSTIWHIHNKQSANST